MLASLQGLFKTALVSWWNDRALSLGAAIAFYTLFSFAPVVLAAIAVAGLVFGREAAQGAIVAEIGGLVGFTEATVIEAMIKSASNVGSGIVGAIVGVATFLLLATGVFVELQDDLNIVFKAKPPENYGVGAFVRVRLLGFALMLAIGFLLLVSLVVDAALSAFGGYLTGYVPGYATLLAAFNMLFGLAVATVLFALIFKILPDVDLAWRDVLVGAVATAALFTVGKILIGLYLGRSGVASSYGAAASIITLLLWVYYSSQILLFGAAFTKAYADSRKA